MVRLNNHLIFNSISELVEELDNSEVIRGRDDSSEVKRDEDWCDTDSYEQAREQLLYGHVYDDLDIDINKYRTNGTTTKSKPNLSVAGHNVVVPLYLQGIPNNMITSKKVINNKIITIFYSVNAVWNVDQQDLKDGATKLFKNIISLEQQGYRVNLYVIGVNSDNNGKWGFCLKLKSDREIFNIKKLCFPIISSSMLRRISFRIKERLFEDWIGGGYGSGLFSYKVHDNFIKKNLRINNYEIWNYKGKKTNEGNDNDDD